MDVRDMRNIIIITLFYMFCCTHVSAGTTGGESSDFRKFEKNNDKSSISEAIDRLSKECRLLEKGVDYETCCKKPSSKCAGLTRWGTPKTLLAEKSGVYDGYTCGGTRSYAEYEFCCKLPDSKCTSATNPYLKQKILFAGALLVVLFLIVLLSYQLVRKGFHKKLIPPYDAEIKAIFSGWFVWGLCVLSYSVLFEDEDIEYVAWLTLPVISAVAVYYWLKKFAINK